MIIFFIVTVPEISRLIIIFCLAQKKFIHNSIYKFFSWPTRRLSAISHHPSASLPIRFKSVAEFIDEKAPMMRRSWAISLTWRLWILTRSAGGLGWSGFECSRLRSGALRLPTLRSDEGMFNDVPSSAMRSGSDDCRRDVKLTGWHYVPSSAMEPPYDGGT